MKKRGFAFWVGLAWVAFGPGPRETAAGEPAGRPVAVFPETQFQWGLVFAGEEVVHRFPVLNEGTAPLRILRVQTSCRCTKKDYTEIVRPGEEGYVTLAVDTSGFIGEENKTARVYTNDPQNPSVVLTMRGGVRPFVTIKPSIPALKGVMGLKPVSVTVTVAPASEVPLEDLKVVSQSDKIRCSVGPRRKDGSYEIRIETLPGLAIDRFREEVVLQARGGGKIVRIAFNVYGRLKPRITVEPQWVIFRFLETEKWERDPRFVPTRRLRIVAAPGVTFSIKNIRREADFFGTELKEIKPHRSYELIVKLRKRPKGKTTPARAKLVVETDDPVNRELTLYVMAFFKEKK